VARHDDAVIEQVPGRRGRQRRPRQRGEPDECPRPRRGRGCTGRAAPESPRRAVGRSWRACHLWHPRGAPL